MFIFTLLRRSSRLVGVSGFMVAIVVYLLMTTPEASQRLLSNVNRTLSGVQLWSESSSIQTEKKKLAETSDALAELKANRQTLQTRVAELQSRHDRLADHLGTQRRRLSETLLSPGSSEPASAVVDGLETYRRLATSVARIETAIDEGSQAIGELDSKISMAGNATDDAETRLAAREVMFVAKDALARGDSLLRATDGDQ